ncbi:MAG: DUF58 domain-containing protein [Eubacteriales bacterium]|nr:DUF58 domain-containing protein [Eubacteriales bacterium]
MNIVWIMAVALGIAAIQVAVYRWMGPKKITYQRYFSQNAVYEGDKIRMIEVLGNMKLLPMPWIRLEARISPNLSFKNQDDLRISGDFYHHSVFSMGPYQRITRTHEITCRKRGCYQMDAVSLTCGDMFGFANVSQARHVGLEVLVYPPIQDFRVLQVPSRRWQGDAVVKRYIEPDPFLVNGIRDYRPGDGVRDVHWAATARMNQLMVKTHDYTASPKLYLLVNVQRHEDQWDDLTEDQHGPIEELLSLCATYAAWARGNGVETALRCNARQNILDDTRLEVDFGGGDGHFHQLMATLARIKILRRRSFSSFLDEEILPSGVSGADIVILSCYWSPSLEERANRLRALGNSVTWRGARHETVA